MFTNNVAFGILYITDMSCISDTLFTEIITMDTFLKDLLLTVGYIGSAMD